MSEINIARRASAKIYFANVDITDEIAKYFISLTYTDKEEDEADDLQIQIADRSSIWLTKWLNDTLAAVRNSPSVQTSPEYKAIAQTGLAVRSGQGDTYSQYGTLPYGEIVNVLEISNGWARIRYSGKDAYVNASYLETSSAVTNMVETTTKGMKIQATIVRQNWNNDGKDDMLECGEFELDSISASGPPAQITIKGTALPFKNSIRQTIKSKSWESYTMSGIAREMAENNGMTCLFLCATDPQYARVEQYQQSDISFLYKLCHDAGFSLKTSNNILIIFDQSDYDNKPPIKTITYGKDYINYKLSTTESNKYTSCRVTYTTPYGNVITATEYVDDYNSDDEDNQCLEIYQKVADVAAAKKLAAKTLRYYNKYDFTATFTFPGDTSLVAGVPVTLSGWGSWDGKYIIKQAKHSVGSGYTTQITLRKSMPSDTAGSVETALVETEKTTFAVGDKVMCNDGVRTFSTGQTMQSWVPKTVLYVRRVEGSVLLLSTEPQASVYTGRVYASDVHKI